MNEKTPIRNIEINKIYLIHDGSKSGHPGYVVWRDEAANRYLVVRFDSDKEGETPKKERGVKHITKLNKPTSPSVVNSYAHNRPMICKRKDIGIHLEDISIDKSDLELIDDISKRNPELAPSLRK